ncbi:MAG: hypothetical protein JWL84_6564 [Rhodospirillales bacterium]|jgi:hypothetical protein|nr:hypothetical protein [Rhodospirillales bacterium]
MSARKFGFMTVLAVLALAGCAGDQPPSDALHGGESQNTAGITKDINATFSTGDSTMNPLGPRSFRE